MNTQKYTTRDWNHNQGHEICPSDIYNKYLPYKSDGYFVEIGVGGTLPPNASNTGDLADMGWRGLYFEPHPIYYKEALERHAHNLDRVKIVNVGLGDVDETKNLFAGDTFLEDVHKHYDKLGWLDNDRVHGTNYKAQYGKPMCKIVNVRQALEDHACAAQFDILSIDVEGYEKKIVSSYDFEKHRPTLVVIELRTINPSFCSPGTGARLVSDGHEVGEIMKSNDYVIIHQDAANTWFGDIRSPHVPRQDPK